MGIFHFSNKYYEECGFENKKLTLKEKYKQLKFEYEQQKKYIEILEGAIEWYKKNLKPEEEWIDVKTCYINNESEVKTCQNKKL